MADWTGHYAEAERLLEQSKNGDTDYSTTEGFGGEGDQMVRQTWAQQAQVHATLALVNAIDEAAK